MIGDYSDLCEALFAEQIKEIRNESQHHAVENIALNLKNLGIDLSTISKATNLSIDNIKNL